MPRKLRTSRRLIEVPDNHVAAILAGLRDQVCPDLSDAEAWFLWNSARAWPVVIVPSDARHVLAVFRSLDEATQAAVLRVRGADAHNLVEV